MVSCTVWRDHTVCIAPELQKMAEGSLFSQKSLGRAKTLRRLGYSVPTATGRSAKLVSNSHQILYGVQSGSILWTYPIYSLLLTGFRIDLKGDRDG